MERRHPGLPKPYARCLYAHIITKKLFDWTNERWVISLSKKKGNLSIKDNKIKTMNKEINEFKATPLYEKIKNSFPDAKLFNVKKNKNKLKDE